MAKSTLWIPRGDSADDDSLLAYAMKTRLFFSVFLLLWTSSASAVVNSCQGGGFPDHSYARIAYGPFATVLACADAVLKLAIDTTRYADSCSSTESIDQTCIFKSATNQTPNTFWIWSILGNACLVTEELINGVCTPIPSPSCTDKIGTASPHLYADGATAPSSACDQGCVVTIDVGASNGTLWVGWGQYTGSACTGQVAASPAPVPTPDSCPSGRTVYNGVCTPLVDIPELGYGGMSISDIQNAIAKSEAANASKKAAAEKLVTPQYLSPSSVPSAPSIQDADKKKAVEGSGAAGKESAKDQGGSGDTQIISGELGAGFGAIVTTLKDIFGGNVDGASVNGAQIDLIVQPTTKQIAVSSITPVAVAHAQAVCPSTNITLQGHPAVWTYTTECNFATSIRPILLAFSWLSATFILVGGIKNG